ncbi:MAG: sorbosone dehydrogenase family protein [candidate division Zixibacteria bacterium]|nr:sorbosone dehydrogenase family protein [candidate division Zixibacteria bacterium]
MKIISGKLVLVLIAPAISLTLYCSSSGGDSGLPLNKIKLPPGFKIEIFAADLPGARSMALGEKGTLFVGTRGEGKVYAVSDTNHDNHSDVVQVIAQGLNMPNGVAVQSGNLYVAEVNQILKFEDIENSLEESPQAQIVNQSLPSDRHHGWKFIRFGPDGFLYVPVGAPCNICKRDDPRYASIMRMRPDGTGLEVYSSGIRNTVGFDWNPLTNELWFTDNGRDWLGDNLPPDELNHAPQKGMHFGFPYCHGYKFTDPEFGDKNSCDKYTPAALELGPHVAALGMRFYTGGMFPPKYKNQILIAEHGSWNRSVPLGYRIMLVELENNRPVSYNVFAEGWLQKSEVWGRPVDVLVMPDGALLVSDDYAGAIYRISYSK